MREPRREGRPAGASVLQLSIEAGSGVPLHRQIEGSLRAAILAGRLAPGVRLPSSRTLAADLGVARNTVLQAYDQLRSEGYVSGCRGGGTRVRPNVPDELLTAAQGVVGSSAGQRVQPAAASAPRVAARLSRCAAVLPPWVEVLRAPGGGPAAFELGVPAVDAFPTRLWWRLAGRRWRGGGVTLSGADPAGEPALREAIAEHVRVSRDARCTAEQVLVVNGAQQALHLIAQVLLDPGDRVWMEDPGYPGAHAAFQLAGAEMVPVRVDGDGLDVAAGERAAADARLAYVTPSHQFPLGAVLSAQRRLALVAWARRTGSWIIEDDYDSEFRYSGRPLACLQGLDAAHAGAAGDRRVLYVGTFSKTLAPALRLGYLVVPDALVDAFLAVRTATDGHSPSGEQRVLADFIAEGHHARHVRRVRALAAARQAVLIEAITGGLAEWLRVEPHAAGLHVVGTLAGGMTDRDAVAAAAAAGVRLAPLSRYCLSREYGGPDRVLFGYAGFTGERIREAATRLRRAFTRARSGPTP